MATRIVSAGPATVVNRGRPKSRKLSAAGHHPLVKQWGAELAATNHSAERCRVYCVQVNAFVNWLKATLNTRPEAISHAIAWRYLYERERTPIARTGLLRRPGTLKFTLIAINQFCTWLNTTGVIQSWENLSWSKFYGGPGSQPPLPAVEFTKTPLAERVTADMPVAQILDRYEADAALNGMMPRTAARNRWVIDRFLEYCALWHEHGPGDIVRDDVYSFIQSLLNTPKPGGGTRSPNTIKKNFNTIKSWCKWATAVRLLDDDPTAGLKGPKGRTVLLQPPPDDVVAHAMRVAYEGRTELLRWRNQLILMFLTMTGVRVGELAGLTRDDVEGRDEVTVNGKMSKQRLVGISPKLGRFIDRYLSMRRDGSAAFLVDHGADWWVIKAAGGWTSMASAERYIHAGAARLGLKAQQDFDPVELEAL